MLPTTKDKEVHLTEYLKVIRKHAWVIITFFTVLVTAVTINSFMATPLYKATAVILIERQQPKVVSIEEVYGLGIADVEYYETQYKILQSRTLAKRLFEEMDLYIHPEFSEAEDPIAGFLSRLTVEPVRKSRLVNLSFTGPNPEDVTNIINGYAQVYIKHDLETRTAASKAAVAWLIEQLNIHKMRLENSELALHKYMEESNIVSLKEIEQESTTLIDNLKEKEAKLEIEISELEKRYGGQHPKMIGALSELNSIRSKLEEESKKIQELRRKAIKYNVLKREAESNKGLYETLLKRAKETGVSEELETSNIRIVDPAEVPESPFLPRKVQNIILAALVGLMLGTALAFFLEYIDNTIKSPEDIEMYVGLPFLGYVPSSKREAKSETEADLISSIKPHSTVAEAYRTIRTAIFFAFADKPSKSILITSPGPQEGKTTVAINLAIIMAQAGDNVLLVDADMRKPRLHKAFDLESDRGLSDLLVGKIRLDTAINVTNIQNLSVITCGSIPPNPSELLGTQKMKEFLREIGQRFDRIILDSPPIVTVTDSSILANIVDGSIEIIRAGKTVIEANQRAKQKLLDAKANILGVILNSIDIKREDYYYYYYYTQEGEKKQEV